MSITKTLKDNFLKEKFPESEKDRRSEFNNLLYGEFKPDYRYEELCKQLAEYYRSTPDGVDNKAAMERWRSFKAWCFENGYTQQEINRAKRDCRFKNI